MLLREVKLFTVSKKNKQSWTWWCLNSVFMICLSIRLPSTRAWLLGLWALFWRILKVWLLLGIALRELLAPPLPWITFHSGLRFGYSLPDWQNLVWSLKQGYFFPQISIVSSLEFLQTLSLRVQIVEITEHLSP